MADESVEYVSVGGFEWIMSEISLMVSIFKSKESRHETATSFAGIMRRQLALANAAKLVMLTDVRWSRSGLWSWSERNRIRIKGVS